MAKKIAKTNAMRMLDKEKISYVVREYPTDGSRGAMTVAAYLGEEEHRVFKTLVTTDTHKNYFVFCLPGDCELDLKEAAKVVGVKRIEMIPQRDLLPLTGYIHGGCSPVGMKKVFPTVMDISGQQWETIYMSGGKVGMQIEMNPRELEGILPFQWASITKK